MKNDQQQRIPAADGLFRIPPRPTRYDESVLRAAATAMTPEFFDYCGDVNRSDSETERMVEHLVDAIESVFDLDGFKIAYELKRSHYWEGDEELVELCSKLGWVVRRQQDAAVEAWITENHVEPKLAVGAKVMMNNVPPSRGEPYGWLEAEITRVDLQRGEYTVFVPALGHVREGIGTHGCILPWESDRLQAVGEGA